MKNLNKRLRQIVTNTGHGCAPKVRKRNRALALFCGGDEGQAMNELAFVVPLLFMIITGLWSASLAMRNYEQLSEAVSVAARTLAASGGITLDPCATASTALYNAAPSLTQSEITLSYSLNGTSYSGTSCSSSSTSTGAAGNLATGDNATMTATYPCNITVYGVNIAPHCTFEAQTTELVQ